MLSVQSAGQQSVCKHETDLYLAISTTCTNTPKSNNSHAYLVTNDCIGTLLGNSTFMETWNTRLYIKATCTRAEVFAMLIASFYPCIYNYSSSVHTILATYLQTLFC